MKTEVYSHNSQRLRHFVSVVLLLCFPLIFFGQSRGYIENKGQWDDEVVAQFQLTNGVAWMMDDRVRFPLIEEGVYHEAAEFAHDNPDTDMWIEGHSYEMIFGKTEETVTQSTSRHKDYVNYFLGNDKSKWAKRVGVYDKLGYYEIAEGIDLNWEISEGRMKYTFVVSPRANLNDFTVQYAAIRGLRKHDENMIITLPNLEVIEHAPIAYQLIKGERVEVDCAFKLDGFRVSYAVGDYDKNFDLFIDPVVVASTNVGSTVNTFGHSATFDQFGNIYGGGRPFGTGYPVDSGSFQMNFAAGGTDIGLSKLNEDGSDLLWSTYIGGSGAEYVHSIVVNGFNSVIVLGKTASTDYPTSTNAFQDSLGGAQDICITVLSDSGDSLIGSTYIGGADNDGQNVISSSYSGFKGEVVCDVYSNVFIASTTSSSDFPVTTNAYQDTLGGGQDGAIFKLNFNLSQMEWSTYLGGSMNDGAFNLKPAKDNSVYVCGITASPEFPTTTGAHDETWNSGSHDAFITRFDEDGEQILQSTLVESDSNGDDKAFFLQLDRHGDVYILGSTNTASNIVADSGKYAGPIAGTYSYIRKYSDVLDTLLWTTTFTNLSHSAFLVDNCKNIYAAGNGATSGLDTLDAVQVAQGGFYLLVLSPEADTILMGSYYGSGGSHVDGGTSRFDKRGAVYQATCTNGYFPLTGNAYSGNQNGGTYDLTVFKVDMEVQAAVANAQVAPNSAGCVPYTTQFTNFGSLGLSHYWDFGDGDTSNLEAPSHTFTTPGNYEVKYVIFDTIGCVLSDTAILIVTVYDTSAIEILNGPLECVETVELTTTSSFSNYTWSTGEVSQTIEITTSGQYWLEVTNVCGTFTDTVDIIIIPPYEFELGPDTGICEPGFTFMGPSSGITFEWNTGDTTQNITIPSTGQYILTASDGFCEDIDTVYVYASYSNFRTLDTIVCEDSVILSVTNQGGSTLWKNGDTTNTITVYTSTVIWVTVTNGYCSKTDTIRVDLSPTLVDLGPDTTICQPKVLSAFGSDLESYLWSTGDTTSQITVDSTGLYWVIGNSVLCSDTDTITIVREVLEFLTGDELVCDKDSHGIVAPGPVGSEWLWSNGDTLRNTTVYESGYYSVAIQSAVCSALDSMYVNFQESPKFSIGDDVTICQGEAVTISVDTSISKVFWSNGDTGRTIAVSDTGLLWAIMSHNGCEAGDTIEVKSRKVNLDSFAMVPNVITPNYDGLNYNFGLMIEDRSLITKYHLAVYNRWGNLVFEANHSNHYWDGKLATGEDNEQGVYYYLLDVETTCTDRPAINLKGHVTVLR